jgi:CubicO group peptidase (beta-lactamase class C family)
MINKQRLLAAVCVAACGGSSAERARVGERMMPAADHIARIEHGLAPPVQVRGEEVRWAIADRMREHRIPAVSIAVFDNYELQWSKAYGIADVETGQRATERTLFLAGSISKSVNALAALLAAADGTLSLDAPINNALESWKLPENELTRARPVTLRMLLSHSAGTTVHGFPAMSPALRSRRCRRSSMARRPRTPLRFASISRRARSSGTPAVASRSRSSR